MLDQAIESGHILRSVGHLEMPFVEYHKKRFDYLIKELEPYLGGENGERQEDRLGKS